MQGSRLLLAMGIALIVGIMVVGLSCAKLTPVEPPAVQPTPTSPVTYKFASHAPATAYPMQYGFIPMLEELEEKSWGRIKTEFYPDETLLKLPDAWEGLVAGVADFSWALPGATPTLFPLCEFMQMPYSSPSSLVGSQLLWKLYQAGLLDEELDRVKILGLNPSNITRLWTVNQPVRSPDDLKGLVLAADGRWGAKMIEAMGGSGANIPISEAYVALERGDIDGYLSGIAPATAHKLEDILKYVTMLDLGSTVESPCAMNWDSLTDFPHDLEFMVVYVLGDNKAGERIAKLHDDFVIKGTEETLPAAGVEVIYLTDEEKRALTVDFPGIYQEWIAEQGEKGLAAEELIRGMIRILEEDHGYVIPFEIFP